MFMTAQARLSARNAATGSGNQQWGAAVTLEHVDDFDATDRLFVGMLQDVQPHKADDLLTPAAVRYSIERRS